MGVLTIDVNVLCVKPITISQPGVQLSSWKRALGRGNCAVWGQSLQEPYGGVAAVVPATSHQLPATSLRGKIWHRCQNLTGTEYTEIRKYSICSHTGGGPHG